MTLTKSILSGLGLFALLTAPALTPSAFADEAQPTHVVELFTSQGCSSCPPANRFAIKLADDPNTLVLSYGVTYWDYLGWTDTFGRAEFTQRQKDYRDAFGAPNIYTPQLVLGGSAHSPRYSVKDVESMPIEREDVGLRAERDGTEIAIRFEPSDDRIVDLVTFTPGLQTVDVARGENGGRTLSLANVVTDVKTLPQTGTARITAPTADKTAYAVLVHDRKTARILDVRVLD